MPRCASRTLRHPPRKPSTGGRPIKCPNPERQGLMAQKVKLLLGSVVFDSFYSIRYFSNLIQQHKKSFGKGVAFMLLSASCLSLGFLFIKFGSHDYPFIWLVFVRYFVGLLCLTGIVLCRKNIVNIFRTNHLRFHVLRAFVITASQYCLFYYLSKSTLLNATLLRSTAPIFIPLIERVFLGHRIGKSTIISLFIAGTGLFLILKPGGDLFEWISLYGLATGFLWAVSQTIYGFTIRKEKMETSIFYVFFLGTFITIPALFIFPVSFEQLPAEAFHFYGMIVLFLLGFFTLLNQYFRGKAYELGKPTTLAIFLYSSIVISGIFDWAFFHIIPDYLTIIGSLLVIIGGGLKIYLRHLFLKRKRF